MYPDNLIVHIFVLLSFITAMERHAYFIEKGKYTKIKKWLKLRRSESEIFQRKSDFKNSSKFF